MINFFISWIIDYILVMFAMCIDNLFWISASPEYEQFKNDQFPIFLEGKAYSDKGDYIIRYRILSVLKSWRDIVPGIITSFIMAVIISFL